MHGSTDQTCDRGRDISDRVDWKAVTRVDLHHETTDVTVVEGLPRAQRLIEDDAEPIDIDTLIDIDLSGQHLGRHVTWSPANLASGCEAMETKDLRRTKVHETRGAVLWQDHVRRLEVSM